MKQVIQSRKSGKLALKEVPAPRVKAGHLLVETRASLISAGTERMVIDFAKKSLAGKAKARPDLVKKVVEKAKRDGLKATFETVMARLDEPLPLGYSAAGVIKAVGAGLEGDFRVGGRVAMAGAGLANHAELNVVPRNLVAAVPDGVSDEDAAFGTVGAIALHAVRNAETGLGDVVAVVGCGLVGQMAAQFLTLAGARVVALDYDPERLSLAKTLGAEQALDLAGGLVDETIREMTAGRGVDAVIIAAATSSAEPFETAAAIARDRARVVMVGMTGTAFPYADFMKKELNVIVSRSYGPGRYDDAFESRGVKYPEGWVRWTETGNLEEAVRLMQPGRPVRLDVTSLITHRFPFDDTEQAYSLVTGGGKHLAVILNYDGETAATETPVIRPANGKVGGCVIGAIGGGNYARTVLLPKLKGLSAVTLQTLVTERGASAEHGQGTFGFQHADTDPTAVFDDESINAVLIATRHDSHAELAIEALKAGKSVWVEKPLALTFEQLNAVIEARNAQAETAGAFFQIGFNRRFAPATVRLKGALVRHVGPKVISMRINAGAIPAEHWVHDLDAGGGRIVGEACHFIDLARALIGVAITSVDAQAAANTDGACDDAVISLGFADGSLANIVYTARGSSSAGKERIEAHAGGATYLIDDFRALTVSGDSATPPWKGAQDKGFQAALEAFTKAVSAGGLAPIDEAELVESSTATLAALESLRGGGKVELQ
ncbi:MAG: Gfo/Idh/MocA family oxidoreductase [Rhodospirillaceae bacterium]|nr:Gfo/Idh/MocA family oxidoreductase [Rhodospirillaceae bacterium]